MMLGSALLSAVPGLRHAFFTSEGGVSGGIYESLNGGTGSNDDPGNITENRRRMAERMGVAPERVLTLYQTHSPDVVVADGPWNGGSRPKADAIVTRTEGLAIGVTAADCGPILGRADRHCGIHRRRHGKTRRRTRRHRRRHRPPDPPALL